MVKYFGLSCLPIFPRHNVFKVPSKLWQFIPSCGWIIFHCIDIPHVVYSFICTLGFAHDFCTQFRDSLKSIHTPWCGVDCVQGALETELGPGKWVSNSSNVCTHGLRINHSLGKAGYKARRAFLGE